MEETIYYKAYQEYWCVGYEEFHCLKEEKDGFIDIFFDDLYKNNGYIQRKKLEKEDVERIKKQLNKKQIYFRKISKDEYMEELNKNFERIKVSVQ